MRRSVLFIAAGFASATLASLAMLLPPTPAAAGEVPIEKAMLAAGEVVFQNQCRAGHSPDPARHTFGPILVGVIDRPAAFTIASALQVEAASASSRPADRVAVC